MWSAPGLMAWSGYREFSKRRSGEQEQNSNWTPPKQNVQSHLLLPRKSFDNALPTPGPMNRDFYPNVTGLFVSHSIDNRKFSGSSSDDRHLHFAKLVVQGC